MQGKQGQVERLGQGVGLDAEKHNEGHHAVGHSAESPYQADPDVLAVLVGGHQVGRYEGHKQADHGNGEPHEALDIERHRGEALYCREEPGGAGAGAGAGAESVVVAMGKEVEDANGDDVEDRKHQDNVAKDDVLVVVMAGVAGHEDVHSREQHVYWWVVGDVAGLQM